MHVLRRPADRTLQKVNDVTLKHGVRRQADRIAKARGFEEFIDAGQGERRVTPEEASQPLTSVERPDYASRSCLCDGRQAPVWRLLSGALGRTFPRIPPSVLRFSIPARPSLPRYYPRRPVEGDISLFCHCLLRYSKLRGRFE